MSKSFKKEEVITYNLVSIAYFLSRRGIKKPPAELSAKTWKEAYLKFYKNFALDKTEQEFTNSLKNLRDHFDSHLRNERAGWMGEDGYPDKLSSLNKKVYDELEKLSDDNLWKVIRGFAITTFDSKKEKIFLTQNKSKYYKSEFSGQVKIDNKINALYSRSHGLVVDKLKDYLSERYNNKFIYNTQKIDLIIEEINKKIRIFEVKTKTDTQSLYTGIGQLFTHSVKFKNTEKWIVIPNFINNDFCEIFKSLSINILFYEIKNNEVYFIENSA